MFRVRNIHYFLQQFEIHVTALGASYQLQDFHCNLKVVSYQLTKYWKKEGIPRSVTWQTISQALTNVYFFILLVKG